MRRRPSGSEPDELDALTNEVAVLRAELEARRRNDDERRRFDALSDALVGAVDPADVFSRAERWATAALGLRCAIVTQRPPGGRSVPLGTSVPAAWLTLDDDARDDRDEAALATVADRIGRALDAARHVSMQASGMRTLERSLLPDALLGVPGLQIASRYVPAPGTHDVGGDFYDAIRVGDTATLIVGDVQGKGIKAATLTSMARHTLRAAALEGDGPARLLKQLNRALLYAQEEQLAAGHDEMLRFVTAAVARLEPRDDGSFTVTVARAGQPPPLVVRTDGRFEVLEPRGVLLGVCEAPEYDEATAALAVGDTLVLYTDGVIEQRGGDSKALSEQHLGMLVRNRRGVSDAEAIASLIEETVHLVAPEAIRDDVAILVACVMRRNPV